MTDIPHYTLQVGQLSALRVLDLHGNRLWHLPPSLEGLRHLSRLDLGDNMLDAVPLVVTRITSLVALDLSKYVSSGYTDTFKNF